ncbi:PAS domain-containing protein [Winogradskyella aurantiaca]|uniref:PAS domain-containing protein n=1 Tax=Winogradskyella aurantiaca TaxID=2219558 RepID=UPI000E1CC654|nr:PAS domain-containing protein [Winogradskyella aurantiaca]
MKTTRRNYCSPLLSFDIYLDHFHKTIKQMKSKMDISEINRSVNTVISKSLENRILNDQYDAIVITDKQQKIVWVSEGFYDMTGYSSSYAVGKQPTFLQGKDTQTSTKERIRVNLDNNNNFSASLINYKKNGEEYICQLKLFPLKDPDNNITHYLALERRLEAA